MAKSLHHLFVDTALEADHQVRQTVYILPLPGFEFLLVAVQADVFVAAREAQGEPALHLPAVTSAPDLARNFRWQVVFQPCRMFGEDFGLAGADDSEYAGDSVSPARSESLEEAWETAIAVDQRLPAIAFQ